MDRNELPEVGNKDKIGDWEMYHRDNPDRYELMRNEYEVKTATLQSYTAAVIYDVSFAQAMWSLIRMVNVNG